MEFFKKIEGKSLKIIKIAVLSVIALLVLALGFSFTVTSFRGMSSKNGGGYGMMQAPGYYGGVVYDSAYSDKGVEMASLSVRNVAPFGTTLTVGNTAEAFEVTDYTSSIETGNAEKTCASVASLKAKDYVIFEHANTYDRGCGYSFKVEKKRVEEILAFIKTLDPRDISENTETIKNQIDDFTSEISILQKKAVTIDETLKSATRAYDDITSLAIETRDASALAKIIDSKIQVIERLTQERINVNAQLDRLSRSKAQQLDRLTYTYFNVNVYENRFIDKQHIKDSWKTAVKNFVDTLNTSLQGMTISLVGLLFMLVQFALYILVVILLAKYGWKLIKFIWTK